MLAFLENQHNHSVILRCS